MCSSDLLGGAVATSREERGYTSTCSYGTPSYRSGYNAEQGEWVTEGPVADFTVHRVTWAAGAPNAGQIAQAVGIPMSDAALSGLPPMIDLVIYHHDTLADSNGPHGDGIVISVSSRRGDWGERDERRCLHFTTTPDGHLRASYFAT